MKKLLSKPPLPAPPSRNNGRRQELGPPASKLDTIGTVALHRSLGNRAVCTLIARSLTAGADRETDGAGECREGEHMSRSNGERDSKVGGEIRADHASEVTPPVPGRQTLMQQATAPGSAEVQHKAATEPTHQSAEPAPQLPHDASIQRMFGNRVPAHAGPGRAPDVHAAAAQGISGAAGSLPHLEQIQRSFGRHELRHVQAHVGGAATAGAQAMGAEAFAMGDHVAFASAPSLHLAAHEAAHVVQQRGGVQLAGGVGAAGDTYEQHADAVADKVVRGESAEALLDTHARGTSAGPAVQRRAATFLERRAWLAFFDHYMPRMFLNHYMDDTGAPITMTQQQMQDCNPIVDIRRSPAFMQQVARIQAAGGGTEAVRCNGWGGALTNGTLGNFTIHWLGNVEVRRDGSWTFSGTVDFYDFWDFDPKGSGSGRPWPAEVKVRVANAFLPGRPFPIHSVAVPASQISSNSAATWPSSVTHVGDHATRTGADIAGGEVLGGPAGGEAGAQSSEDLNR